MRKMLQRLFPIAEVRVVLSAYQDEVKSIRSEDKGAVFSSVTSVEMLNKEILYAIHASKDSLKQEIASGKAPRVLALLVISNIVYRHITSGQYHVYRGLLSMEGKGLKVLWRYTMNELEKVGELSAEDRRIADQNLNEEVKEAG